MYTEKEADRRKVASFRVGNESFIFVVMPGNCLPTRIRYRMRIHDISHAGCCVLHTREINLFSCVLGGHPCLAHKEAGRVLCDNKLKEPPEE